MRKRDKTLCLCVDYHKLNAVSQLEAYPMPRIEDLLDQLGKAKFLTTLDLGKGYWQIPVKQSARDKTAFVTPFGLYQFTRMPFGLSGAPGTFQRLMDKVLRGHHEYAAAYLDDIIIHSESWEDHIKHITVVLNSLMKAGLTAKPSKCQFGRDEIVYLGHRVERGRVQPEQSKIKAIQDFPKPATKKQVRAFLGLAGYYWKFIKNFSEVTAPLSDMVKQSQPSQVTWNENLERAFCKVKDLLCDEPVLQCPNFDKTLTLQTDASNRDVGAVLSQKDEDGTDYPIAYFSRKLIPREPVLRCPNFDKTFTLQTDASNQGVGAVLSQKDEDGTDYPIAYFSIPREQKYSTIEKECLAIKLGVEAFRVYLMGRTFEIQTDHRSLEGLNRLKADNAQLTKWSLSLQPYKFRVIHRSGSTNTNADILSRFPTDSSMSSEEGGEVW